MKATPLHFGPYQIAAVIPVYRVEREIESVLSGLPAYIRYIIVVDDASPDSTFDRVKALLKRNRRLTLIHHERNLGVGAAMVSGFRKALDLGAQIVVKVDGDGQMDINRLPELILPFIEGQADYTKRNRFPAFIALP